MDIKTLQKTGCDNCGSHNFNYSVTTPVVKISAGQCRSVVCSNGYRHEDFECSDCGRKIQKDIYDHSKDKRKETIAKVMSDGGIRELLRVDAY